MKSIFSISIFIFQNLLWYKSIDKLQMQLFYYYVDPLLCKTANEPSVHHVYVQSNFKHANWLGYDVLIRCAQAGNCNSFFGRSVLMISKQQNSLAYSPTPPIRPMRLLFTAPSSPANIHSVWIFHNGSQVTLTG